MICPEFSPDEARSAIADGDSPELDAAQHVAFVDLDSGHWPMFSQPAAVTEALIQVAHPLAG